ncbi:hypothetical protein GCM10010873_27300 [Cypionkella aquatica]|uniref:Uncharacterized protein n=1 Tax=Cypionkella aquatica TaxID=1756042 RepID=A0AA37X585_9RHOB|nr:hypothetical protein [Cypionkella aquatica]GLS87756.1 hypothetical protein GCM10010873_27300 [Cypionkella aquatica]
MDRIIQMILNRFLGRLVNIGVNKGIDYAAGRGKSPDQMTPAEREQARAGKDMSKRARQAAKLMRRIR